MVDPISDMLARIKNAHQALHAEVEVPMSRSKLSLAEILKEEGYVTDVAQDGDVIRVKLKYESGKPLITGLKRISRPGRRVYVGVEDIPRVRNGLGVCVISTSHGIMAGENARAKRVGGEVMCEIW
jgi:small subunit ribosomal protein S8